MSISIHFYLFATIIFCKMLKTADHSGFYLYQNRLPAVSSHRQGKGLAGSDLIIETGDTRVRDSFKAKKALSQKARFPLRTPDAALNTVYVMGSPLHLPYNYTLNPDINKAGSLNTQRVLTALKRDLAQIGLSKGFVVRSLPQHSMWLGNSHTPLADGRIYFPKVEKKAYEISRAARFLQNRRSIHHIFQGEFGEEAKRTDIERDYGNQAKIGKTYLEAGNMRVGKKRDGSYGVVIGSDSLYMSMLILDRDYELAARDIDRVLAQKKFSDELIDRTVADLTLTNIKKTTQYLNKIDGVQKDSGIKYDDELSYGEEMSQNYALDPDLPIWEKKYKAQRFLAKLELTKEAIARDLEVKVRDITFVDQPDAFHLDLALAEHPKGGFLVHSDKCALDTLRDLAMKKAQIGYYDNFMDAAKWSMDKNGAIQERLAQQLEEAGYEVDLIGARFGHLENQSTFVNKGTTMREDANYLNGRSAIACDGSNFHLALGTGIAGLNKAVLEDLIRDDRKLKMDEVFLIGAEDVAHQEEPYKFTNSKYILERQGALRCITFAA